MAVDLIFRSEDASDLSINAELFNGTPLIVIYVTDGRGEKTELSYCKKDAIKLSKELKKQINVLTSLERGGEYGRE